MRKPQKNLKNRHFCFEKLLFNIERGKKVVKKQFAVNLFDEYVTSKDSERDCLIDAGGVKMASFLRIKSANRFLSAAGWAAVEFLQLCCKIYY